MVTFIQVELFSRCQFKKTINPDSYYEYEEGDIHKPYWVDNGSIGIQINESFKTHTFSNVTPRKGREFNEIELPIDYTQFDGLTTLSKMPKLIKIFPLAKMTIYGWIDEILPVATKGPKVNTLIRWHVDYWITSASYNRLKNEYPADYANRNKIVLGHGRVKRGLAADARPDPSAPRKWIIDTRVHLAETRPYIIVYYTSSNISYLNAFPVGGSIENYGPCMNKFDAYNGNMLTRMQIAPSAVIGIWAFPYNPIPTGSVQNDGTYYWYNSPFLSNNVGTMFTTTEITTGDNIKTVVTDAYGNISGTLPWGTTYDYITTWLDIGTNGASMIVLFSKYNSDLLQPKVPVGKAISISLPSIPVFSNAKSDYVYSGQREYDMEMAKLNNERGLINGITNTGQGAVGGAVMGSVAGKTGAGAVAGAALSLAGTGINFAVQAYYDVKSQEAVDKLMANQASNTIIGAGGPNWYYYSGNMEIITMKRDSVSEAELAAEQSELGYITDYFESDCQTLIQNGGGFRIEGAQVKGDILPEGKAYIQALLARGVHIDLIS